MSKGLPGESTPGDGSPADGRRPGAFFDLDRTLLAESSGFMLMDAFAEAGLLSERDRALAERTRRITGLVRGMYRQVGETWIGMQITRRSVKSLTRWSVGELREAARSLAELIDDEVYEEARAVIDWHKREGHLVAVATSTGREIVEPIAHKLGIDVVIATEYATDGERLTGEYVGEWLWGPAKAEAVRRFAESEGVDLEVSFAYSDSYYDRHLLRAVGFPRAVNPDVLLRALSVARGWPVLAFRGAASTPRTAFDLFDIGRPLLHPAVLPPRIDIEGLANIPADGPCIVACNHRSYLDGLVMAAVGSRRGRRLRFLGKREIFEAPVVGQLARAAGQIPVDRGSGSTRPLQEALEALARGEAVAIFPQGTIPRGESFFAPELVAKTGVARLAVASGAPVIPVAVWGTELIWPRNRRLPDPAAMRGQVRVVVGEPMTLRPPPLGVEDAPEMRRLARRVIDRIVEMLPPEVRTPPAPSSGQVAAASPPPPFGPRAALGALASLPTRAAAATAGLAALARGAAGLAGVAIRALSGLRGPAGAVRDNKRPSGDGGPAG